MPGLPAVNELLPFLIVGAVSGSLYGLAATGLVLTYGTSGVFNFGHGSIAAAAAFVFYELHHQHGLPWPVAAVLVVGVFGPLFGVVMELVVRRLVGAPQALVIIGTVGIFLAITGFLLVQSGSATRNFPAFLPTSGVVVADVLVSWGQIISIVVSVFGVLGLGLYLRTARLGVAMRGVVDNPVLTQLTGEPPVRLRRASWMIGCSFAAATGILIAPTLGLDATLLSLLIVQTFGACAVGRFSSLPLAFGGGVLVGVLQAVSTKYFERPPWSGVPASVPFVVLVVVLLAVPAARLPHRQLLRRFAGPRRPSTRLGTVLGGAGVVALVGVPALVDTRLPLWINALTTTILLASLALLVLVAGQISLCHAAFAAFGATTFSHLLGAGLPWPVALFGAGLATVPVGALVAIPAIRLSGLYLALATFGFGVLVQFLLFPSALMFGSSLAVSAGRPAMGGVDLQGDTGYYYVVLLVAVLTTALLATVHRSRLGRLLRALSEVPTMLGTHGLDVNMTRLAVFGISAFLAGIAGALRLAQTGTVGASEFGPISSLLLLVVLAIAGTSLLRAPVIAAILLAVLPGYLPSFGANEQLLAFGVAAIAVAVVYASRAELDRWFAHRVSVLSAVRRAGPYLGRSDTAAVRS